MQIPVFNPEDSDLRTTRKESYTMLYSADDPRWADTRDLLFGAYGRTVYETVDLNARCFSVLYWGATPIPIGVFAFNLYGDRDGVSGLLETQGTWVDPRMRRRRWSRNLWHTPLNDLTELHTVVTAVGSREGLSLLAWAARTYPHLRIYAHLSRGMQSALEELRAAVPRALPWNESSGIGLVIPDEAYTNPNKETP